MQNQTKPKPFGAPKAKIVLVAAIIISLGAVAGYYLIKLKPAISPTQKTISAIEISVDAKSILNAETKEVIFTIEDANKYLKYSGYAYNPDTFQTTNAKYEGGCFTDAALSIKKDRIVFSSGCLAGDLPQAWIGNFYVVGSYYKGIRIGKGPLSDKIDFLIAGSGRNFIWSADDKTITYEADLRLSGMIETRTIDSYTGEILDTKKGIEKPETGCTNLCGDGICQEIVCMAIGCPCAETPQSCLQDCQKNETGTENWKTYRNEEYGFEVKYPNDWSISDHSSGLLVLKNTQEKMDGAQSFFVINIKKNYEINSETSDTVMEKISIGGRLSYKYFYQEGAGTSEVILIQLGKDALELSLDYFASNGSNFNDEKIAIQKIINPILSTFKFIEK